MIAWWVDWKASELEPIPAVTVDDDTPQSSITSRITVSGKPQFRIGGSAKTFTVRYYNKDDKEIGDYPIGEWSFAIDGDLVPAELLETLIDGNKVKVRFLGDDSYIGKILTVINTANDDVISSIDIEIIAL